jgi:hypothetical protein
MKWIINYGTNFESVAMATKINGTYVSEVYIEYIAEITCLIILFIAYKIIFN